MESKLSDERRTGEGQGVKSLLNRWSNIYHHVIQKAGVMLDHISHNG